MNPQVLKKEKATCFHCGDTCNSNRYHSGEHLFCCMGCKTVYELLAENGLEQYYLLEDTPGFKNKNLVNDYTYLNDEQIQEKLLSFSSEEFNTIELELPDIHCSSCIWLLENLDTLNPGILNVEVNFAKKRARINFNPKQIELADVAGLLNKIGYPPQFNIKSHSDTKKKSHHKSLFLKIGIAGFCFGNIMLLSFPEYIGIRQEDDPELQNIFHWLSFILVLPVVFYCSRNYFESAWKGLTSGLVNIDVPISIGIITLFLRSFYEITFSMGAGYFDSLAGLLFFLLIGKWLQSKTYERLSFERDFRSYFPMSVCRKNPDQETFQYIPMENIKTGDHLFIRNQEIIPADSILRSDLAYLDYSFVTGESKPVKTSLGDNLFAGGRHTGKAITVEVVKPVEQSYLTSLWNNSAFKEKRKLSHVPLLDRISKNFTLVILSIAILGAVFWFIYDSERTWQVFTSVLIVACPCALVLSVPFTYSNVMDLLGKMKVYLRGTDVIGEFQEIDTIVFDKTGTLTSDLSGKIKYIGKKLTGLEKRMIYQGISNSSHPLSIAISKSLEAYSSYRSPDNFEEVTGEGILANFNEVNIKIGSLQWVGNPPVEFEMTGSSVHIQINGTYYGYFSVENSIRTGLKDMLAKLNENFKVFVLSGDKDKEKDKLVRIGLKPSQLYFGQTPHDKLNFIKNLQDKGSSVLMVGDGLNDSGALRQSNLGIAVTNESHAFTPASDIIMLGDKLSALPDVLKLTGFARKTIIISFIFSFLYNVIGIALALTGMLTPIHAAILMPLSSITVLIVATISVRFYAFKNNLILR